jgi:hypothetical protein
MSFASVRNVNHKWLNDCSIHKSESFWKDMVSKKVTLTNKFYLIIFFKEKFYINYKPSITVVLLMNFW